MTSHFYSNISSFSLNGLTLEDAYSKLDKEISQLQEHLRSLRTLRNTLAPVSKLPAELLSRVFSDIQGDRRSTNPKEMDLRTRFVVSWVCRHWRDNVLSTPSIWSAISTDGKTPANIEMLKEVLLRSRSLSLAVRLSEPTRHLLTLFVPQMNRIQHLQLSNKDTNGELGPFFSQPGPSSVELDTFLSQPAPALTSLELAFITLPSEPIFSGVYPQLRSLFVKDMFIPTVSPLITTVTKLHIERPYNHISMTIRDLLNVLAPLQQLTELVLIECFEEEDRTRTIPAGQARLTFPRLQTLSVSDETKRTVFNLLRCLDLPTTEITVTWPYRIDLSKPHYANGDFLTQLKNYTRYISQSLPIRHAKITGEPSNLILEFSSSPSQNRHTIRFPLCRRERQTYAEAFIGQAIPLHDVQSLSMNEYPENDLQTLKKSTNLTSVTLDGTSAVESFICDFYFDIKTTKTADKIPFPALKELVIRNVRNCDDWDDFRQVLASRDLVELGLDRLVLDNCFDDALDVDRCRDFVRDVSIV